MTARLAFRKRRTTESCSAVTPVSPKDRRLRVGVKFRPLTGWSTGRVSRAKRCAAHALASCSRREVELLLYSRIAFFADAGTLLSGRRVAPL